MKNSNRETIFELSELILLYLGASYICGTPIIFDLIGDLAKKYNYSKSALYKISNLLKKKGLIEQRNAGFKITISGMEKLSNALSSKSKGPWDGKWRLVAFDIPESLRKVRATIRASLKSLGLGMMQKSVWVSAYDVKKEVEFLASQFNIKDGVRWFEGNTVDDPQDFVQRCWDLAGINDKYETLVKEGEKLIKSITVKDFIRYKEWEKKYFKLLHEDPQLPAALLPQNWQGNMAGSLHHSLRAFYKI